MFIKLPANLPLFELLLFWLFNSLIKLPMFIVFWNVRVSLLISYKFPFKDCLPSKLSGVPVNPDEFINPAFILFPYKFWLWFYPFFYFAIVWFYDVYDIDCILFEFTPPFPKKLTLYAYDLNLISLVYGRLLLLTRLLFTFYPD